MQDVGAPCVPSKAAVELKETHHQRKRSEVCWTHFFGGEKLRAIVEMPRPIDKAGVQRFLGMFNYIGKFVPNTSDVAATLRVLLHKDTEWHWFEHRERNFVVIIETSIVAPVLAFYDPIQELTLQVDACLTGVGETLIQRDRPVAYASKAFTPTSRIFCKSRSY